LELDDCKSFHARVMTPDNLTLAVVGDFDAGDMEQLLIKLTRECKARKAPAKLKLPAIPAPKASKTFISLPGSAQLQFFMGHAGITRDHPDFHALLVMDHVLGTGPGFTDRLSGRLRDREGLAYTVRAEICSSSDLLPGIFACYIGTDAKNLQRVEAEFLEEIARLRKELATKDEVEDAKSYLLGNLPFRYDGVTALAEQLLFVDRFGWKEDHLERFSKAIAEVTPEMVRAVAQKHILPAKLHLVAAGAIDKNGEPLK
jgi:zinc protease